MQFYDCSLSSVENFFKRNVKFLYMATILLIIVLSGLGETTSTDEYPELIKQITSKNNKLDKNFSFSLYRAFSPKFPGGICGIVENMEGFPTSASTDKNKLTERFPWVSVVHLRSEKTIDDVFPAIIIGPSLVLMTPTYFRIKETKKLAFQPLSSYTVAAGITDITTLDFNTYPAQSSKVSHIRIHPNYNYETWEKDENSLVLLHLKTPFKFNNFVRPICIPMNQETIDSLSLSPPSNNNSLLLTGWKRNTESIISLNFIIQEPQVCKKLWNETGETNSAVYKHRMCGFVDSANSHINCIHRDNGAVRKLNRDGSYYFVASVNNFYSDNRTCTSKALYFFSILNTDNLKWMDNNLRCGPNNYTCTNGECVSIDSICNQRPDCTDSSDEDPVYCRGFNPCFDNFACGTYGKCISSSKVCDLVQDCDQGEDEAKEACPTKEPDVEDQNLIIGLSGGGALVLLLILGSISFFLWKKLKRAKEQLRNLTPEEVKVFLSPTENDGCDDSPGQNIPYDKKYEILSENLKIIWAKKLGSGAFGVVFKGELKSSLNGEPAEEVAVKTFMSEGNITHLKSLLMELKVQIFVGEHENILRLIGAYTEKIQTRILYIVLEFCHFGSLQDYLRNNCDELGRQRYENIEERSKSGENGAYANLKVTLKNLTQWSYQIAKGMEFLSSRNVTHGDLATRNVLLNRELIAKISDFGLARKLYDSGVYSKETKEPLPWPWMAPESLRSSIFSTQSDVWSYGVTLWEIFSCGSIPYGGMRWTTDFVDLLDEGMRLNKPANASIEIYKIMTDCWNPMPKNRPYFQQLVHFFAKQLQEYYQEDMK